MMISGIESRLSRLSPTVLAISAAEGRYAWTAAASAGIALPLWFRLNVSRKFLMAGTFDLST